MCFETLSPAEVRAKYAAAGNKENMIEILSGLTVSTKADVREFLGLPPKKTRYKLAGTNVMELYQDGMSDKEIALRLEVTPDCIRSWRKRNNLPKLRV